MSDTLFLIRKEFHKKSSIFVEHTKKQETEQVNFQNWGFLGCSRSLGCFPWQVREISPHAQSSCVSSTLRLWPALSQLYILNVLHLWDVCIRTNTKAGGRPSQSFRVTNFLQEFHSFLFTVFAPAQIPHDALMDGLTVSITTIPPPSHHNRNHHPFSFSPFCSVSAISTVKFLYF